ncbi:MAG: hypothetical protein IT463_10505 [Planctomycetes bacterium]|nr:hypothetical protein [Planctomycetota bacterium]
MTLTPITATGLATVNPSDLAFSPVAPYELWITCQNTATTLDEYLIILDDAAAASITGERIDSTKDGNWGHFYLNPSALDFGAQTSGAGNGWTFATAQDGTRADNHFMGPTLWSADRTVIGHYLPGFDLGLGSHLDMLHSTRYAKGISHEASNIDWVLGEAYYTVMGGGGPKNCLTRYDFKVDHMPGKDDHSDGVRWNYAEGAISTLPGVPAHIFYEPAGKWLYACDPGNHRIVKLDTTSGGTPTAVTAHGSDGQSFKVTGATLADFVAPGLLTTPCGLEIFNNTVFVSDYATGIIHAFDMAGNRINWLDTGLGANAITGMHFGPDGKLYFCDQANDRIVRIDP